MKKISVLFVSLVALVSVISCNKDDDKDEKKEATIEGKWERIQEGETLTTLEPSENEGGCGNEIVELLNGGKYIGSGAEYSNSKCNPYTFEGKWSKNGNMLSMQDEGDAADDVSISEIIELSDSTLKLKESDEEGTWFTIYKRK